MRIDGTPELTPAQAMVEACVASLVAETEGQGLLGRIDSLDTEQLEEAYWHTYDTLAATVAERPKGLPTAAHVQRVRALGVVSSMLAQHIDSRWCKKRTDELYMGMESGRGASKKLVTGLFDFFGILYRREVEALYAQPDA